MYDTKFPQKIFGVGVLSPKTKISAGLGLKDRDLIFTHDEPGYVSYMLSKCHVATIYNPQLAPDGPTKVSQAQFQQK